MRLQDLSTNAVGSKRGQMWLPLISVFCSIVFAVFGKASSGEEVNPRTTIVVTGGVVFVFFEANSFRMGCPSNSPSPWIAEDSAQPEHPVNLSAFYLSKYPITVRQFVVFLNAVGMKKDYFDKAILFKSVGVTEEGHFFAMDGMQSRAVTGITHAGAKAFCAWFGASVGQECRLPTEAEWECAARGKRGRIYPWGDEIKKVSVWNDDVGQHPELTTVDGVYDLNGPVAQWCLDEFDAKFYTKSPTNDPLNETGDGRFVLRGGPMMRYGKSEELVFPPAWKRFARKTVDHIIPHIGFRVVLVPKRNGV